MAQKTIYRGPQEDPRTRRARPQRTKIARAHPDLPSWRGSTWMSDTRTKAELPKLDICKIRPDRLRDLDYVGLQKAQFFIGPVTMKERTSLSSPRGLTHNLLFNLIGAREAHEVFELPGERERIKRGYEEESRRIEKQIYDLQQKKGCSIATSDAPARDYIREGGRDEQIISKARGRRKAKIR